MINSQKLVRIRIEIGKPKRKSGVYVKVLHWGIHGAFRQMEKGSVFYLTSFHHFQKEEGFELFEGRNFRLIPYETRHNL